MRRINCETALTTATPAQADRLQERQLERSVRWTGRERLRLLWYWLRLEAQEFNYASKRMIELLMRLPDDWGVPCRNQPTPPRPLGSPGRGRASSPRRRAESHFRPAAAVRPLAPLEPVDTSRQLRRPASPNAARLSRTSRASWPDADAGARFLSTEQLGAQAADPLAQLRTL